MLLKNFFWKWRRVFLLVLVLGLLYGIGQATGLHRTINALWLKEHLAGAGFAGYFLFLLMFCGGLLVQVPGLIFVIAAYYIWGDITGFAAGYSAALVALSIHFWLVKLLGGAPLRELRWQWAKHLLASLEQHPWRSVILVRLLLFMSPPANVALALSGMSYRTYLLGSAVGIVPVMIFLNVATHLFPGG